MKNEYNNKDIKLILSGMRSHLRNGNYVLRYKDAGAVVLRKAVASYFGIEADDFNTKNFNPQTLKRVAALFDVPSYGTTSTLLDYAIRWPSQDDTAKALQNFINRRSKPWEFWTDRYSVC